MNVAQSFDLIGIRWSICSILNRNLNTSASLGASSAWQGAKQKS